jgi:hypothetical protein
MQRSHGGHKSYPLAAAPHTTARRTHVFDGVADSHFSWDVS